MLVQSLWFLNGKVKKEVNRALPLVNSYFLDIICSWNYRKTDKMKSQDKTSLLFGGLQYSFLIIWIFWTNKLSPPTSHSLFVGSPSLEVFFFSDSTHISSLREMLQSANNAHTDVATWKMGTEITCLNSWLKLKKNGIMLLKLNFPK